MYAVVIEALPTRALRILAIARHVGFSALFIDDVMLAGHIEHGDARFLDDLLGVVELLVLRKMRRVACVDHKRRFHRKRLDLDYCFTEGSNCVWIGGLIEARRAIADLEKAERPLASSGSRRSRPDEACREGYPPA